MRGATRASRARGRTAGFPPPPARRSCHAGASARSFRWATSRRRRRKAARGPRRAHRAAIGRPPRESSTRGRRGRGRRHRARRETNCAGLRRAAPTSTLGKVRERNCSDTFETARIPAPFARTKTHCWASGQVTRIQRPSGVHVTSSNVPAPVNNRRAAPASGRIRGTTKAGCAGRWRPRTRGSGPTERGRPSAAAQLPARAH